MKLFSCSRTSDPDYTSYLLVFLVALGARIFFLVWIDEPILFVKYPYFADKLVGGGDIGERLVDLSPFYLYWMAFLQKIFGIDWATAKLIQSFIGALNALFVLALGKRLFNKTAGIFSALLYALYGNIIILESTLEPTVFILSFNLISIYFLVSAKEKSCPPARSTTLILAAGMLTGLSIITKPNALLFLPLVMGWFIFFPTGEETFHRRLAQTLVFCISASLMVMPVTLRNYVKLNDSVLVTADAGKVFYHGNSKAATALNRANLTDVGLMAEESDEPDFAHVVFRKTASRITGKPMSPSEASRFWIERTLHDIYSDPSKYFGRTLKKLVFFFTDYELHYIASAHQEYKRSLAFPFIRYGILASLGLLGMSLSVRRFPRLFLLYGSVGIYLLAGLLFLVQSRYRTPAAPYLSLFAGSAIYSLKGMIMARRYIRLSVSLSLVGMFFFLSFFVFNKEISRADQWQEATKICYQMRARPLFNSGRYHESISQLDQCLSMVPNFRPALTLRGRAYAMLGQYRKAERDFKRLISLNPGGFQGHKNIGFIYLLQGETDKARRHLYEALILAPHDKKVKEALRGLK